MTCTCPECGREAVKYIDRTGKETPKSDFMYSHERVVSRSFVFYRDHCFSDEPPVRPEQ